MYEWPSLRHEDTIIWGKGLARHFLIIMADPISGPSLSILFCNLVLTKWELGCTIELGLQFELTKWEGITCACPCRLGFTI